MFSHVLIAVDGREGGRDAIALVRGLAAPGTKLTLAHIYTPLLGKGGAIALPSQRAEAKQLLERERQLAGLEAGLVVRQGVTVGRGLHELAEELESDLLVVGSTRHAIVGRVLMGDDTRAAYNGAPCAIAIAPRGYAQVEHRWAWLGVGYDESPESVAALAAARELAGRHGAKVKAVQALSLQDARDDNPHAADCPQTADDVLDRGPGRLDQPPEVIGVATYGGPREELARFGAELDLLIVGSRGYGPLGRIVHGSVSSYLVKHACCPLLVLPRAAVRPAEPDPGRPEGEPAALETA
jgi:nucleotide-binding universal stress UspA family protein